MTKGFSDFLNALNRENVRYVVIGGMAVLSYLPYRTTRDIDVLIEATPENAAAARRAVQLWGGFETFFVSLEDLIAMKTATGRPEKDLPDLERLRLLRERKGRNAP